MCGKNFQTDWVNPSKRGGMDVHPDSFTWIYILFKIGYFGDISDFFKY